MFHLRSVINWYVGFPLRPFVFTYALTFQYSRITIIISVQNVVLKMCKKRALVDAVLNVGGLSSKFTQDIEDMDLSQEQVGKSPDELKSQPKTPRPATKKQIQYLQQLMQQHGNTEESMNRYVKQAYGVDDYKKITGVQCSELIEKYKALDENK